MCWHARRLLLQVLLSAAQSLPLYPELALLHSREGSHAATLLLLTLLPPRLVEGAITYCRCAKEPVACGPRELSTAAV